MKYLLSFYVNWRQNHRWNSPRSFDFEKNRERNERASVRAAVCSIHYLLAMSTLRSALPLSTRAAAHNFALSFIKMSQNDYILTHYFSPIFFLSGGFRKMWFIPFNSYHFRESTDNSCRVANAPVRTLISPSFQFREVQQPPRLDTTWGTVAGRHKR